MSYKIFKEEGEGYNNYIFLLFRAYCTCSNENFTDEIEAERRCWIQGKLKDTFSVLDLMDLIRLTYNNSIEDDSWQNNKKAVGKQKDNNYLALST